MTRTNFTEAKLIKVIWSGTSFPGTNLNRADMTSAYLAHSSLELATLLGTDFRNTDLSGQFSGSLYGTPILPSGWVLKNGIIQPG